MPPVLTCKSNCFLSKNNKRNGLALVVVRICEALAASKETLPIKDLFKAIWLQLPFTGNSHFWMSVLKLYPKHLSKHSLWISAYNLHSNSQRICFSNLCINTLKKFLPCGCRIYFHFVNFWTHFFCQHHIYVNSFSDRFIYKRRLYGNLLVFPPQPGLGLLLKNSSAWNALETAAFKPDLSLKNEDVLIKHLGQYFAVK